MKFLKLFYLINCLAIYQCFAQNLTFDSLAVKIDAHIELEQYDEARNYIISNMDFYPDLWFELSEKLIYINEKQAKYEDNLKIFKTAHTKGYFYLIHPQIARYKPYLELNEFDTISKCDLSLLANANNESKTIYEVQLPENYDDKQLYPAIFLLHGGGRKLSDVKKQWQTNLLNSNYIKVYVQSYRHYDSKNYGWGNLEDRLDNDFKTIYDELKKDFLIDTNSVYVGGISAGGSCAIDLSLRSVIPVKGYITYCPGIPKLLREKKFQFVTNSDCKGYIVAGENDFYLDRQKQMTQLFDSLQINYEYIIVKNMGHEYPSNESYYVESGLKYINQ